MKLPFVSAMRNALLVGSLCLLSAIPFKNTWAVSTSDQGTIHYFEQANWPELSAQQAQHQFTVRYQDLSFQLAIEPNHQLMQSLSSAVKQQLTAAKARYFSGQVLDAEGQAIEGSWLRLSYINQQWSGAWFAHGELYLVDAIDEVASMLNPHSNAATRAPEGSTIVFSMNDLTLPILHGADPLRAPESSAPETNSTAFLRHIQSSGRGASNLQQLPLTIVTDTQFSNTHNGNTTANVLARLNLADGIYTSQLSVSLGLLHHEVLNSNGSLTSFDIEDLLNQFRAYMRSGEGSLLPRGGLAHLFTGRNVNGGFVGLAYIGVLCSITFGYGVDQDFNGNTTSALIFAHELGHNFSSPHDGEDACASETFRGIMNPVINGSTQFSNCSIQQMSDDINNASCLLDIPLVIYETGFEQN
jgi:hypothetical protein